MATYNRAHLIKETLESIKNQTYPNFECLIIDDGGQDDTKIVVEELISEDKRFSYLARLAKYKKGLPGCRNYGLDICKGDYVVFFDDDDLVHPDNLLTCIKYLKDYDLDFINYNFQNFWSIESVNFEQTRNEEIKLITSKNLDQIIKRELNIISCSIMFKRNLIGSHRFNEKISFAEELEYYIRILLNSNFTGGRLSQVLYFARKHKNSMTINFIKGNQYRINGYCLSVFEIIKNLKSRNRLNLGIKKYLLNELFVQNNKEIFKNALMLAAPFYHEWFFWRIYFYTFPFRSFLYRVRFNKYFT